MPRASVSSGPERCTRAEAIFDGLAAGTFLYIATFGILKEEYSKPQFRWQKYFMTAVAVALIALVSVWA